MVTGREVRFGLFLLVGFVVLFFFTCGHGSGSSKTSATPTASPTASASAGPTAMPTLPPTPPPTSPLPVPSPGGQVGQQGTSDSTMTVSPATYESASDPCAYLPNDVAPAGASSPCQQQWSNLQVTDIPGADLMNSMGIPHQIGYGTAVSKAEALEAGTAFYRWQAFQTWAENTTAVAAMEALDPIGHPDPVVAALSGQSGAHVTSVPPCNLPVAIRVVKLDSGAVDYIRQQGWNPAGTLAIVATYPSCPGISITTSDHKTTVVAASPGLTAINPGELTTLSPFGKVWKLEGEVGCGSGQALATVCAGGS